MGNFSNITRQILLADKVTAEDVLALRRSFYDDGKISHDEADDVFAINTNIENKPADWLDFYIGAMTDFLIRQTPPHGYIDEASAMWLIQRIDHDGVVDLETEFELLMHILYYARSVPDRLEQYALTQVKLAVFNREGTLPDGRKITAGRIDEYDVECLRRILYACSGCGGFGISRLEAQMLFELDELTQNVDNDPAWQTLFVKANLNYLMTLGAPKVASRERMLQNHEWLNSKGSGIDWLGGMASALKDGFSRSKRDMFREVFETEEPQKSFLDNPAAMSEAEAIDLEEASWLIDSINSDGRMSDNERALLKLIKQESPKIHSSLRGLIKAA